MKSYYQTLFSSLIKIFSSESLIILKIIGPVYFNGDGPDILGSILDLGSSFTISMWMIVLSFDVVIMTLGRTESSIGNGFLLSVDADGYVVFVDQETISGRRLSAGVTYGFSGRSSCKLSVSETRQHLVFVKDGLTATFYINGMKCGTITSSTNILYDMQPLILGGDVLSQSNYLKGQIDNLVFYNMSFNAAEVDLYLSQSFGMRVNLIHIFCFLSCFLKLPLHIQLLLPPKGTGLRSV